MTVHPRPTTTTHGRGGFFIHGGENWGSAGCIDLTYGMASFAKVIEPMSNCHIPVVVDYNGTTRVPPPSCCGRHRSPCRAGSCPRGCWPARRSSSRRPAPERRFPARVVTYPHRGQLRWYPTRPLPGFCGTRRACPRPSSQRATIDLDDEPPSGSEEVDDETTDGHLPAKPDVQTTAVNELPEQLLGRREPRAMLPGAGLNDGGRATLHDDLPKPEARAARALLAQSAGCVTRPRGAACGTCDREAMARLGAGARRAACASEQGPSRSPFGPVHRAQRGTQFGSELSTVAAIDELFGVDADAERFGDRGHRLRRLSSLSQQAAER